MEKVGFSGIVLTNDTSRTSRYRHVKMLKRAEISYDDPADLHLSFSIVLTVISAKYSDAGLTPVTNSRSLARVQAT